MTEDIWLKFAKDLNKNRRIYDDEELFLRSAVEIYMSHSVPPKCLSSRIVFHVNQFIVTNISTYL